MPCNPHEGDEESQGCCQVRDVNYTMSNYTVEASPGAARKDVAIAWYDCKYLTINSDANSAPSCCTVYGVKLFPFVNPIAFSSATSVFKLGDL